MSTSPTASSSPTIQLANHFDANSFTGYCRDESGLFYDGVENDSLATSRDCAVWCYGFVQDYSGYDGLVGFSFSEERKECWCDFEADTFPESALNDLSISDSYTGEGGSGAVKYHPELLGVESSEELDFNCFRRLVRLRMKHCITI